MMDLMMLFQVLLKEALRWCHLILKILIILGILLIILIFYGLISCKISRTLNTEHLDYVVDEILYYYVLKHWIIEIPDKRIHDEICMWGVPFVIVNKMSIGKLKKIRIHNNVFRWEPREDAIYITHKHIVIEIFDNIY